MNTEGQKYPDILPIQEQPGVWEYALQKHEAEIAGTHYDLRLGADDKIHSWAIRKGLPEPGRKYLAVQQPTHKREDLDFSGRILYGYGKGLQKLEERDQVDVLEATNDAIKFNRYKGRKTEKYKLIRTKGNKWLIINYTPTHKSKGITDRPKYIDDVYENIDKYIEGDYIMSPKYDGAHAVLVTAPGKEVGIFSYREAKAGLIEHTPKFEKILGKLGPDELGSIKIRGEVWAPIPLAEIGGFLNRKAIESRKLQTVNATPLQFIGFDVEEFKGEGLISYDEKLKALEEIAKKLPIEVTDYVKTLQGKRELVQGIWEGRDPRTNEGVVAWPREGGAPVRIPVKKKVDVIVKEIFPIDPKAKVKKDMAGGFWYALEDNPDKIIGKVGIGFTDAVREEMWKNRDEFIGMVAKVETKPPYPSGILRTPAFKSWHLDKYYGGNFKEKVSNFNVNAKDMNYLVNRQIEKAARRYTKQEKGIMRPKETSILMED